MGFDPKPTLYTGLHCSDCFGTFDQVSTTGPVTLCQKCTDARVKRLHANSPDMVIDILPVPGDRVVCGMRFELPKSERGHEWTSLGIDTRHSGEFGEFTDMEIFVCLECGRDKQKRIPVPRVTVDEAPLIRLLFIAGYQASDPEIQALNMKKVNHP
jgi:hypothetical protein